MSQYIPVPVVAAKSIAEAYQKAVVIIIAGDNVFNLVHTTTYGVHADDKLIAAEWGERLTPLVNGNLNLREKFEDFRDNADALMAARYREAIELLQRMHRNQACVPHFGQEVERYLKSVGAIAGRQA